MYISSYSSITELHTETEQLQLVVLFKLYASSVHVHGMVLKHMGMILSKLLLDMYWFKIMNTLQVSQITEFIEHCRRKWKIRWQDSINHLKISAKKKQKFGKASWSDRRILFSVYLIGLSKPNTEEENNNDENHVTSILH